MANPFPDGWLGGLRVVDLADEKASFCTKLLADLGAEVIKVEPPAGDAARQKGPFAQGDGQGKSLWFEYHHTNKLGITLNIDHPIGHQLLVRLIGTADVVVESFEPGYLDERGLGYPALSRRFPGLIMASVSGFGQSGPNARFPACDVVAAAEGGQTWVNGVAGDPPQTPYGEQTYYTASLLAAVGVLMAVHGRRQQGQGRHIDISLQEAALSTLDHVMPRYFHHGQVATRLGGRHWNDLFHILPCRDGFIHLTPFEQWDTLVDWLAGEGMAEDLTQDQWQDPVYRITHADHVIGVLSAWTRTHAVQELCELAQLMRLPWAPVETPAAVLASEQLRARGFFARPDHSDNADWRGCPARPYRCADIPPTPMKAAPRVGEHNRSVYARWLGLTAQTLAEAAAKGVV